MTAPSPSTAPHRWSLALAVATLALIGLGGLVTSTHSGLTVPDWPLSYGRLMPRMIGGILFEHGHRLAATTVGLLTIVTAVIFRREPRAWLRRAAWAALGLVILQGVFGGLTVLLKLPKPVSIVHATLAQTFFCLTVALAVWTSPLWKREPSVDADGTDIPLPHIALLLVASLYLQLILGATVRHTGHALSFHLVNAGLILLWIGWAFHRLSLSHAREKDLWAVASAIAAVFAVQCLLGLMALLSFLGPGWPAHPWSSVGWATAHVVVGALLLGLSIALALLSWRRFPGAFNTDRLRDYVSLTKPGITLMAALTALAGFLLASRGAVSFARLGHTALGTLLVSAGACALNMLMERDRDALMARTGDRPLPARRASPGEALFLGALLLIGGVVYLGALVNGLTAGLAAVTAAVYLYAYTPLKKISTINTLVGAVAGALPPVFGWSAATGRLEVGAAVLFGILFFWQFPHFFALAWLYREDYSRAGFAMLPVVHPDGRRTSLHAVIGALALLAVSLAPAFTGSGALVYTLLAALLGGALVVLGFLFHRDRTTQRARRLFLASVLYLPVLLTALVWNGMRP
ncbi:MAG: protoheme IX farnesyltransferase [Elusimicrobia bacterium]|nr:MAG: protoheme IX farnesyltransferase [Elusimicrobiota bacterium]